MPGLDELSPESGVYLIWEDAEPCADRWWSARAREIGAGGREFFIAEDDFTDSFLALMLRPGRTRFTVVAAVFLDRFESRAASAAALKAELARWLAAPQRPLIAWPVWRWRLIRILTVIRRNALFALVGIVAGAVLGLAVALFALSSGLVGWPMVVAGVAIGALSGPLLRRLVERHRAKAVAGPWGRFAIITICAMAGAAITAGGMLYLFAH